MKRRPVIAFADAMLRGFAEPPKVALGPLVWGIATGHDQRHWYFIAGATDGTELRILQFKVMPDDRALAQRCRMGLVLELLQRRPALVVVDFDAELPFARWCEALCPCERSTRIRQAVEREHADG